MEEEAAAAREAENARLQWHRDSQAKEAKLKRVCVMANLFFNVGNYMRYMLLNSQRKLLF